jgi:hypothetical protein
MFTKTEIFDLGIIRLRLVTLSSAPIRICDYSINVSFLDKKM